MNQNDYSQLHKMHEQLRQSGVAAFDSAYLERYTELLAKSLEGKSDAREDNIPHAWPHHPVVRVPVLLWMLLEFESPAIGG